MSLVLAIEPSLADPFARRRAGLVRAIGAIAVIVIDSGDGDAFRAIQAGDVSIDRCVFIQVYLSAHPCKMNQNENEGLGGGKAWTDMKDPNPGCRRG